MPYEIVRVTDNLINDEGKPLVLRFKCLTNGRNIAGVTHPSPRSAAARMANVREHEMRRKSQAQP